MGGKHLKHMFIAGGALLAVLVVVGVPFGRALQYALALACPLMMVFMMATMGRDHGGHTAPEQRDPQGDDDPNEHATFDTR